MTLMASGLGGFGLYTEIIGTSACIDMRRESLKMTFPKTGPDLVADVDGLGLVSPVLLLDGHQVRVS